MKKVLEKSGNFEIVNELQVQVDVLDENKKKIVNFYNCRKHNLLHRPLK